MDTQAMDMNFQSQGYFQPAIERDANASLLPHFLTRRCSSRLLLSLTGFLTSSVGCNNNITDGDTSLQLTTKRGSARRQRFPLVLAIVPSNEAPPKGDCDTVAYNGSWSKRSTRLGACRASRRLVSRISANATATPACRQR
jgi:hypothetical protein